jgi:hypothetical protein
VTGVPEIFGAVLAWASGEEKTETDASAQKAPYRRRAAAAMLENDIDHPVQKS